VLGRTLALACALTLTIAASAYGNAVGRLSSEVQRSGVWVNTANYTPPVYRMNSSIPFCWTRVLTNPFFQGLDLKWRKVPLRCDFQPAGGSDSEAVVMNSGLGGTDPAVFDYYEFWGAQYKDLSWQARWGGAADNSEFTVKQGVRAWPTPGGVKYGTQASGIAFVPGLILEPELRAGKIGHVVSLLVPYSCPTWRSPATRTDGSAATNPLDKCLQYGTLFKLPADVPTGALPKVPRLIAEAAKTYGLMVTDQTHSSVAFRAESWQRKWSSWGSGDRWTDPYSSPGGHFGCDGYQSGKAVASWAEYDCYPDKDHLFRQFPWDKLVEVPPGA
jgi:hypothetical protein